MTSESVYGKTPRGRQTIIKEFFFDKIPEPKFKVTGLPTRAFSTFWNADVLPTSIKIRQIYVHNYHLEDNEVLESAWSWLQNKKNKELFVGGSWDDDNFLKQLPLEILLNKSTSYFFTMEGDFRRNPKVGFFEPFIVYKPGTNNWENDIRRLTFDYVEDLLGRKPIEVLAAEKMQPSERLTLKEIDNNMGILERFKIMDNISWTVLWKYNLELLRRENAFFDSIRM